MWIKSKKESPYWIFKLDKSNQQLYAWSKIENYYIKIGHNLYIYSIDHCFVAQIVLTNLLAHSLIAIPKEKWDNNMKKNLTKSLLVDKQ